MKTVFINTENSKTNEPHKLVLNLSQRLGIKSSNEHVALQPFITRGKIQENSNKNNKLKIIAPTWMMSLNYQMVPILFQIFKIISSTSLKSMKYQLLLLFMFKLIELIID